jgi:hypothetical protein
MAQLGEQKQGSSGEEEWDTRKEAGLGGLPQPKPWIELEHELQRELDLTRRIYYRLNFPEITPIVDVRV